MYIAIDSIVVAPERQRKDLGDITGLAASIRRVGLIQPIAVTPLSDGRYKLQAGERRLRAHQNLGLTMIYAKLLTDLPIEEQELIELEENVRRKDLSWQEQVKAVARYVALANEAGKSDSSVAEDLQLPKSTISKMQKVAEVLPLMPKLADATSWSAAYNAYSIEQSKKIEAIHEDILSDILATPIDAPLSPTSSDPILDSLNITPNSNSVIGTPSTPTNSQSIPRDERVFAIQEEFQTWVTSYNGPRFNLVHCDFPYGLSMDTANLQASSVRWELEDGRYADSPELFDLLVRAFFDNQDRFIADSAHCIFWLAHKNVGKLMSRFKYYQWNVCEVPLIWHKSDNAGIAPDVNRQPRRTYEIAVFASRGDRKIKKVKSASFSSPTTKEHHLSEKPLPVVTHFLEMLVDEHTTFLDPTCGSGTALEAALKLGARSALGLDAIASHVSHTNQRCRRVQPTRNQSNDLVTDSPSPSPDPFDLDISDL